MKPSPEQQGRKTFEIALTTESERKLATIMFKEKRGLSNTFSSVFDVHFTNVTEDTIYFRSYDDTDARKAFTMLVGAITTHGHISKELIRDIERQLNPCAEAAPSAGTGTETNSRPETLAAEFGGVAANQNNPKGKFAPYAGKQQSQVDLTNENDITFAIGPAGTGKTYIAMDTAVKAFIAGKVEKILVARPAVETGEKLGYQPGDQNAKMAPYVRPLYDAIDKTYGKGKYQKMLADGSLEIVPIGFMRGRTFEKSFVIVDEAQNCEFEHLKMAITRLGFGSKMVITGDPGQVDLKPVTNSGLQRMVENLEGLEGVGVQRYDSSDVVRHPTVQRIIEKLEGKAPQNPPASAPKGP